MHVVKPVTGKLIRGPTDSQLGQGSTRVGGPLIINGPPLHAMHNAAGLRLDEEEDEDEEEKEDNGQPKPYQCTTVVSWPGWA